MWGPWCRSPPKAVPCSACGQPGGWEMSRGDALLSWKPQRAGDFCETQNKSISIRGGAGGDCSTSRSQNSQAGSRVPRCPACHMVRPQQAHIGHQLGDLWQKGGAGDTGDTGGAGDTGDAEDATRVWPALCRMLLLPALTALSQSFLNASTTDPFWTRSKR